MSEDRVEKVKKAFKAFVEESDCRLYYEDFDGGKRCSCCNQYKDWCYEWCELEVLREAIRDL